VGRAMKRQAELIKKISDKELVLNVYFSQLLVLIVGIIFYYFLKDNPYSILKYFSFNYYDILIYSFPTAAFVILLDLIISKYVPKKYIDDGGINKRIFQSLSFLQIVVLAATVAVIEEIVFRGILQVHFGVVIASLIFAILHFRYLSSIVMFILVVAISFLFGFLFIWSNNLIVTIVAHFLIDVSLGLLIRYKLINL
jgi:uncharacterized protein